MDVMITNLQRIYDDIKTIIKEKLECFNNLNKKEIKMEFIFCLLTPQSEAKKCWQVVLELKEHGFPLDEEKIKNCISGVRFKNKKANYIKEGISKFESLYSEIKEEKDIFKLRKDIVMKIKGIGWKEASHFLRNIGKGENFAILDRHILKCLCKYGVIEKIPESILQKQYINIENKMREFSKNIKIPLSHLDFLFWYIEKGEIFK